MITSINQVHEEFFKLFFQLNVENGGSSFIPHLRYAKKSSYDFVEEDSNQKYPCIAVQDYPVIPKEEWFTDMREVVGDYSADRLTAFLYKRPVWMEFRYDVSICAKSFKQFTAMQNKFAQKFMTGHAFIFNAEDFDVFEKVGEVIPYTIRATDIPRMDGVLEQNYEFTLSVWLHSTDAREVDVLQKIVTNVIQNKEDEN